MGFDGHGPGENWVRQCAAFPGFMRNRLFLWLERRPFSPHATALKGPRPSGKGCATLPGSTSSQERWSGRAGLLVSCISDNEDALLHHLQLDRRHTKSREHTAGTAPGEGEVAGLLTGIGDPGTRLDSEKPPSSIEASRNTGPEKRRAQVPRCLFVWLSVSEQYTF